MPSYTLSFDLKKETDLFRKSLATAFLLASKHGRTSRQQNPLFWNLRNAFVKADERGVTKELKYSFESHVMRNEIEPSINELHHDIGDLRYPYEWYPGARALQRTVHLHVGPTNSGKTYHALKALESARTGVYAGPLRLLAHEIYTRFQAKKIPCALVTGEEQRIPEGVGTYFQSCTVEMAPLGEIVDVAVIDEIQMISDEMRGWAWSQALMGIQAKELHLCGEERSVELLEDLCRRMGDKVVVHRYERLNALHTMDESLGGDFKKLQKGDCVVAFTRVGLHGLKKGVEEATGRKCAIVYGSLPPETRAHQAALFNDPTNDYDFLVASDAIGMGLNLEIKRVIFESASKFDGATWRHLTIPEIKQIGGRAGRFRTANNANQEASPPQISSPKPAGSLYGGLLSTSASATTFIAEAKPQMPKGISTPGYVTAVLDEDLHTIKTAFSKEAPPLRTAGLAAPPFIVERFASHFPPGTPFAFILSRLREKCRLSERFHLCDSEEQIEIAELIEPYPLTTADRIIFTAAPVSLHDPAGPATLQAFVECVAYHKSGHLCDIPEVDLEVLQMDRHQAGMTETEFLRRLERLHMSIGLYLWLSYRYEGVFQSQHLAFHVKELVEARIAQHLEGLSYLPSKHKLSMAKRRLKADKHTQLAEQFIEENESVPEHNEGPGIWEQDGHEEPLGVDELDSEADNEGKASSG
ncbi:hypothetical protein OQA88_12799 [Cercophora sp. LCS_1]